MEDLLKRNSLGTNFLSLAGMQEGMKKALYVDIDHYSSEMSDKIAKRIYNFLSEGGYYGFK